MKDTLLFAGFVENEAFYADGTPKFKVDEKKAAMEKERQKIRVDEFNAQYKGFDFIINKDKANKFWLFQVYYGNSELVETYKGLKAAEKRAFRMKPNAKIFYENF